MTQSTATPAQPAIIPGSNILLSAQNVNIFYGDNRAVKDVNLNFARGTVNALIGPSGCGKTTFLRAINRMHDLTPGARVTGQILLDGEDIYDRRVDPVQLRARVGMVFQKPVPFPMTIFENVAYAIRHHEKLSKAELNVRVEGQIVLGWREVPDPEPGPGEVVIDVIAVGEPVDRMVHQHQVGGVRLGVKNGLHRAKVETLLDVVGAVSA